MWKKHEAHDAPSLVLPIFGRMTSHPPPPQKKNSSTSLNDLIAFSVLKIF